MRPIPALVATWFVAAILVGAPVAAQPTVQTQQFAVTSPDPQYLADPHVRELSSQAMRPYARRIGHDGASGRNDGGDFSIKRQRNAFRVVAGGYALGGAAGESLMLAGLSAVHWGLEQRGPDGSFPPPPGNLPLAAAFFIQTAARSLLLARDGDVPASVRREALALQPALHQAATALAADPLLRQAEGTVQNSNGLFVSAAALQQTAILTGDAALTERARALAASGLARQLPDGTFPEKHGFDAGYQSVSLEYLSRYAAVLPPSSWRDEVFRSANRGLNRFLQALGPSGRLDDSANTRTMECDATGRDKGELLGLRLHYLATILNRPTLTTQAERVEASGQRFAKIERCPTK